MTKNTNKPVVAHSENIRDLLSNCSYEIPDYQRDYVWNDGPQGGPVSQLWTDLIEHLNRNVQRGKLAHSPEYYFLGAVVVIEDLSHQKFLEVIDGQQRLVTLSCMASVLRDLLVLLPEKWVNEKQGYLQELGSMIATYSGEKFEPHVRLQNSYLNSFFTSSVTTQSLDSKESYWRTDTTALALLANRNNPAVRIRDVIRTCFRLAGEYLGDLSNAHSQEMFLAFTRMFLEYVVILRIVSTSHSTAYDLFESLNNRGISLNQADLVKNELIKSADNDGNISKDEVTTNWTLVKETVEANDVPMKDFLHYSILSREEYCTASKIFDRTKNNLKKASALEISKALVDDADALEKLQSGDNRAWSSETNNMLKDIFEVLKIKFAIVALLAAHRKCGDDKKVFEQHVRLIMNFCFRYLKVMEENPGLLAKILCEASDRINKGMPIPVVAGIYQEYAPDKLFVDKFKTAKFHNTKLAYFCCWYLERNALKGAVPLSHGDESNLEHIMPKAPGKGDWPRAQKLKKEEKEIFTDYLWRVGNTLALPADINKSIQNRSISHKYSNSSKKDYQNCPMALPKIVYEHIDGNEWTTKSIENFQNDIAERYACNSWKLA